MTDIAPVLGVVAALLAVAAGAYAIVWVIGWGNRQGTLRPGAQLPAEVERDYAGAGISLDSPTIGPDIARGALLSVDFTLAVYHTGNPPHAVLEVAGATGADFKLEREGDGMRQHLRLGSGHALQTGDKGIPPLDSMLATDAEKQAARALFRLGFDRLERRDGALRATKFLGPHLPELELLRRCLAQLEVLRSG